jgi:hypothetical protein
VAKYSTFKYGAEKYGTGDPVEYVIWHFNVAWDGSNFVDEASRMIDLQIDRGRDHLLTSGGAWERFRPGEASAMFDNEDGRFDPYNSSGDLFGSILPGRVVRITVDIKPSYSDTTITYPILRGIIDDIQPFFRQGRRQARIVVKDGLEWLARRSVALALLEDTEALDVAGTIAGTVGFDDVDDWSITQLGSDSKIIPYSFGNEDSALALINQFVDAEAGQVFHAADGVLTFVTNDYTAASTINIDQAQLLRDYELKTPWDVVRTKSKITANPLVEGSATVLWTFGNEGTVSAWEAVNFPEEPTSPILRQESSGIELKIVADAIFTDLNGAATSPTVDYEAVFSEGLPVPWTDVTANPNLDFTSEDIGTGLRLTWTWAGAIDGGEVLVITFADITATPIEAGDEIIATASNSAAITTYGEKTFILDCPFIQEQAYAQSYADYVVAQLKDAHKFPTIMIENRGTIQFLPDLYVDKIALTVSALGISDTFRVGKISHRWKNENGFAVQTTLKLEPVLGVLE